MEGGIPKVIHYCWFGHGEKPELIKKCIKSWSMILPEYKIVEWNEDNFDIRVNPFVFEACNARKFAFVADYARLFILYHYGGVYLDADVEIVRSLDEFLSCKAFSGFESERLVPTGIIGAQKGHPLFKALLDYYEGRRFIMPDGSYDITTNCRIITKMLLERGLVLNNELQTVDGFTLYPRTYFCPLNWGRAKSDFSEKTAAIHHFAGTWLSDKVKRQNKSLIRHLRRRTHEGIAAAVKKALGDEGYKKLKSKIKKTEG